MFFERLHNLTVSTPNLLRWDYEGVVWIRFMTAGRKQHPSSCRQIQIKMLLNPVGRTVW